MPKVTPSIEELHKTVDQLIRNKKFEQAIKVLGDILKIDKTNADAYTKLGDIYYNLDLHEFTIATHIKAIFYGANSPNNYFQRGYAYTKLKNYQEALNDFQQSYKLGDKSIGVVINIAVCYRHLTKYSTTIKLLTNINLNDKKLSEKERLLICINIATSYFKQNRLDEALEYFLTAEKLNLAVDADSFYTVSKIYKEHKKFETSIIYLNRAIIAKPDKEVLIKIYEDLSSALLQIKDYNLSLSYAQEALKLDPESEIAKTNIFCITNHYFRTGIDHLENKDYTQAIIFFKKVNTLDGLADRELSICYYKTCNPDKALSAYNSLFNKLRQNKIMINARHYYKRGIIYFKLEKFPQALFNFMLARKLQTVEDSIDINKVNEYIRKINSSAENHEEKIPTLQF